MALTDEELRDVASHPGLKLVKSRRRKPGVGDYGLFGLVDAFGNAMFGISDDGLTATPEQIADFLREGEAPTWAASAKITSARAKTTSSIGSRPPENESVAASAVRPRPSTSSAFKVREARQREQPAQDELVEPARAERPNCVRGTGQAGTEVPAKTEIGDQGRAAC